MCAHKVIITHNYVIYWLLHMYVHNRNVGKKYVISKQCCGNIILCVKLNKRDYREYGLVNRRILSVWFDSDSNQFAGSGSRCEPTCI